MKNNGSNFVVDSLVWWECGL